MSRQSVPALGICRQAGLILRHSQDEPCPTVLLSLVGPRVAGPQGAVLMGKAVGKLLLLMEGETPTIAQHTLQQQG